MACERRRCTHPEVPACLCCGGENPALLRVIEREDGLFHEDLCDDCAEYHERAMGRESPPPPLPRLSEIGPYEYVPEKHMWRKV